MSSGPTQNYDDTALGQWKPHPVLAVCVRVLVVALPPLGAIVFGLAAVRWASAARLGMNIWLWLAVEVAASTVLLVVAGRACRRLLPLSALLRLTAYFPDRAPTRFAVARRRYSPQVLHRRVEARRRRDQDLDGEHQHAALLLDLVANITEHDDSTRGHSERVQAYAALIARELGLSARDSAKLSWAALLHDVGKLRLDAALLNKAGLPTDDEWAVLATHPAEGMELTRPLGAWLGEWADAIGQHHERWDGNGYPRGLAGPSISRGARIVAVADAYDAITSARAYKKPLTASAAREELARCSGQQFDPEVVRAFLAIGLGRLRVVAGPASVLSALPGLGSTPLSNLASVASGATTAVTTVAAVGFAGIVGAVLAMTGVPADAAPTGGSADSAAGVVVAPSAEPSPPASRPSPTSTAGVVPPPAGAPTPGSTPSRGDFLPPRDPPPAGAVPPPGSLPPADVAPSPTVGPSPTGPAAPPPTAASTAVPVATPCARAQAGDMALAGADLSGCDLAGRTLTGDFAGANLVAADLTGATLTMLDLSGAKLTGTKLNGATITATSFDQGLLTGAIFTDATVSSSSFVGASLGPATLNDARVSDCTF
ncbi:MAG TPA: HD domain-containing phosphohydrolase [Cellulomonas sp.]|uniref:HD domain-containing phosphohydrolase n=1 Tax=Cellulomonas sp. TaxID=40001 RepID=UPI002E3353BD|nr:HD domain-containing phosphohydrolase [Cellulomonas sp.]HEX5333224.1 HD domain-containing phosphohydrolase [Cellulomonas sp.]